LYAFYSCKCPVDRVCRDANEFEMGLGLGKICSETSRSRAEFGQGKDAAVLWSIQYTIGNLVYWANRLVPPYLEGVCLALQYMDNIKISRNLPCYECQIMKVQFMDSGIPKEHLGAEQLCDEIVLNTFHDFTLLYTDASVDGVTNKSGFGVYIQCFNGLGYSKKNN